jgi:bacterioferritin-associated ferredoxin
MDNRNVILCRCEDVSREDVRKLLEQGYVTFEDLKRQLRVGMGPCQGTTCAELIQREIATFLQVRHDTIALPKVRPMAAGVKLKSIKEAADEEDR